jgi:predicted nucleotidyltransferase
VYLFGSVVNHEAEASDVDILIVYQTREELPSIREWISTHALRFPLDVTYMSETEENELNFIFEQKAKPLHEILVRNRINLPVSEQHPPTS